MAFYAEHNICMAISEDALGRPGTWKKLYDGSFSEPGLGGKNTPLSGLERHAGGNPSVHFNTHLKRWVMVWHTWDDQGIWISFSEELVEWYPPQPIVKTAPGERLWYATVIGETDQQARQNAVLYYARFPDKARTERELIRREIQFW